MRDLIIKTVSVTIAAFVVIAAFYRQILDSLWPFLKELPGVEAYAYYSTPDMKLYIICNYVAVGAAIVLLGFLVWMPGRIYRIAAAVVACMVVVWTWVVVSDFTHVLPDYLGTHLTASASVFSLAFLNVKLRKRLWTTEEDRVEAIRTRLNQYPVD